jgi:hypothetical protein
MTFEASTDADLVRSIMTHPSIYGYMGDDSRPPVESFIPCFDKSLLYVTVKDKEELIGMFLLVKHSAVKWEAHTMMLPNGRGRRAIRAYREGVEWCKSNGCKYLFGIIPEDNVSAVEVALLGGMEMVGIMRHSVVRGGKLICENVVGKELSYG